MITVRFFFTYLLLIHPLIVYQGKNQQTSLQLMFLPILHPIHLFPSNLWRGLVLMLLSKGWFSLEPTHTVYIG